jgi:hypothetical protein
MTGCSNGRGPSTNRVLRGRSWSNNARNCRSANRNNNNPDNRNNNNGFRLALHFAAHSECVMPRNSAVHGRRKRGREVLAPVRCRRACPSASAHWIRTSAEQAPYPAGPVGGDRTSRRAYVCPSELHGLREFASPHAHRPGRLNPRAHPPAQKRLEAESIGPCHPVGLAGRIAGSGKPAVRTTG